MQTNAIKQAGVIIAIACLALPAAVSAAGVYAPSALGFDISFNSRSYPYERFNFGIVGVSGGKAFKHNDRLASEYAWARAGTFTAPTVYMNLNAPYGSTVAGHVSSPKACPGTATTTAVAGEPNECEGYNYGYNAAQDAVSYAKSMGVSSPIWWLDIEEANSWSATTTVNGATIQGAIDYLNAQGIQAGVYSMAYMWRDIAGKDFAPTQTINGKKVVIPTWLPIGIATQTKATNACVTRQSFIPGSPIWLIQYVANSTAVDQNLSC